MDVQRRRISDREADVRGETAHDTLRLLDEEGMNCRPRTVSVSKRNRAWRNGRTRATGRNEEKPLVDWYRSTMDKPKTLHPPRYLSPGGAHRSRTVCVWAIRSPPSPPAGPRPRHGQPRGRAQQESRVRRLHAARPAEGRGPAQTPQTAQGGRGHATVGRDRRRVAQALEPGADSQPAEAGLPG